MNPGTKEQMEAVRDVRYDYYKCCEVLKNKGLYEVELSEEEKLLNPQYADNPYKFGHGWLAKAIPEEDIQKIKTIIETYNKTRSVNLTLEALEALEAKEMYHEEEIER